MIPSPTLEPNTMDSHNTTSVHQGTTRNENCDSSANTINAVTKLFAQQNLHAIPSARLNQIAPRDREDYLYDVHGVLSEPIDETPEFVQDKLGEVERHLPPNYLLPSSPHLSSAWPTSSADADNLLRNGEKNRNINNEHQHKIFMKRIMLSCLRTERFNTEKAALRVVKHLEARIKFFGRDSIGKELGIHDLNALDRRALEDGAVQLLNKRDRSGRAIIVQFSSKAQLYSVEVVTKLLFWSGVMAARDEKVQNAGIIYILYSVNDPTSTRVHDRAPHLISTLSAMLARIAAIHYCTDDLELVDRVSEASSAYMESQFLCRIRSHFGTTRECKNNLMTFGIPVDVLPVMDDGVTLHLKHHKEWIAKLVAEKEQSTGIARQDIDLVEPLSSSIITERPNPHDVILGRGSKWKCNPGNQCLRRLLEENRPHFDAARRKQKSEIITKVYLAIRAKGSRFLLLDSETETWSEVSEFQALDRISHGFRNLRLPRK